MSGPDLAALHTALEGHGLCLRGGFNLVPGETLAMPDGRPAQAVLLIGNVGGALWPHFERWRRASPRDAHPLDAWSRLVVEQAAVHLDATAVFPSQKPYYPFQRWAMRAEGLRPSPLGILMHPQYGLWHAYRAALLFTHTLDLAGKSDVVHLCDACAAKPCLTSCPVGAHDATGFDYQGCLDHVRGPDLARCMHNGCGDRNACPNAKEWRYPPEMQRFLMQAFAA